MDEWAASVGASTGRAISSSASSRAILSSDRIASLKAAATSAIAAAGKADSTKMDEIIPAMLNGISSGMSAGYSATEMASVLDATTTAVVGSVTKTGREASLTTGLSVSDVVGISTTKIVAVIIDKVAVTNPELTVTTIGFIVDASISSLSSSATISTTADKEKAIASIVSGVSDSVFASVATTSSGLKNYAEAAMSAIGSSASAAIVVLLPAADAQTAVTKVVENTVKSASTNGVLETAVLQSLVASVSQGGAALTATQISSAISAGSTTAPSIDVAAIDAIVNEVAPSVTASASVSTITENKTVNLTATASGVTYAWTQISGPIEANITGAASATASVYLSYPGTYGFRITVKNSAGFKKNYAEVKILANFSAQITDQGVKALAVKDFDGARSSFLSAYAQDPSNATAAMWSSLLDLAAISVNSDVVDLMKSRIGFVDYPSTMNTLFSTTWFNQAWYMGSYGYHASDSGTYIRGTFTADASSANTWNYGWNVDQTSIGILHYVSESGTYGPGNFVPSESGKHYVLAEEYESKIGSASSFPKYASGSMTSQVASYLPKVSMPDWMGKLVTKNGGKIDAISAYPLAVIGSIIERNPAGFNEAVDKVLAGTYGNAFEAVYTKIMALADDASITVPRSVLTAFGPVDSSIQGITIEGRELKLYAAQMRLQKALVEYISSYTLTYPVSAMVKILDGAGMLDGSASSDTFNFAQIDNPFEAGFLADRGQGRRESSKADFEAALTALSTTASGFDAAVCQKYVDLASGSTALTAADIATSFTTAKINLDKVNASIEGTDTYPIGDTGSVVLKLSVLFDRPIFSLGSLVETTGSAGSAGSGFVLYGTTDVYTAAPAEGSYAHSPDGTAITAFSAATDSYAGIKIKTADIDALFDLPGFGAGMASMLSKETAQFVTDASGNLYMMGYAGSKAPLDAAAYPAPGSLSSLWTMFKE